MRAVQFAAALLLPAAAAAAPDLAAPRDLRGFRVYPDFQRPGLYYLAPGDLEVATDENGKPKLHFLQMRYTGTALTGNQGERGSLSTLTIGVRLHSPPEPELIALRKSLQTLAGRVVELRPLPVTAFEAVVAYAPIGAPESEPIAVQEGYFESDEESKARTDQRAFWRERTFTIPMNAPTAELFWDLLHRQELALSLAYAFFTRGVYSSDLVDVDVQATEQQVEKEIRAKLKQSGVPMAAQQPPGMTARLLALARAQVTGEKVEEPERSPAARPSARRSRRAARRRSGSTRSAGPSCSSASISTSRCRRPTRCSVSTVTTSRTVCGPSSCSRRWTWKRPRSAAAPWRSPRNSCVHSRISTRARSASKCRC